MFTFSNPEVAANYEPVFGVNKKITIQKVYWGLLSDITPEVAELLISKGDNQIRRKSDVAISNNEEKKDCGCPS